MSGGGGDFLRMKRLISILASLTVLALIITATACHDSIFSDIQDESDIDSDRLQGAANAFVLFKGNIYFSAGNKGEIYRKSASAITRGGWETIKVPGEVPGYLYSDGTSLYLLTITKIKSGTGKYEGMNVPAGWEEYTSTTGNSGSFNYRQHYEWTQNGSTVPDAYKTQHLNATIGTHSYSVSYRDTSINGLGDVGGSDEAGSVFCLAPTADYLLIGGYRGLFHVPAGGSVSDLSDKIGCHNSSASIFDGQNITAIYVAGSTDSGTGASKVWSAPSTSENDSIIYVWAQGRGSRFATKGGLYSYIPGEGDKAWNSEG